MNTKKVMCGFVCMKAEIVLTQWTHHPSEITHI